MDKWKTVPFGKQQEHGQSDSCLFTHQCSSHPGWWFVNRWSQLCCPVVCRSWSSGTAYRESCLPTWSGVVWISLQQIRTGTGWGSCGSRQWPRSLLRPIWWLCCFHTLCKCAAAPVPWRTMWHCKESSSWRRQLQLWPLNGWPVSLTSDSTSVSRWSLSSRNKWQWQEW